MGRWVIRLGAASETGLIKQENQDRILARIGEGPNGDFGLFAVADGMGSQRGGGQAADIAVHHCETWWSQILPQLICQDSKRTAEMAMDALARWLEPVHGSIQDLGRQLGSKPGTTLSVLFLYDGWMGSLHIGDSRIYQTGSRLLQLTRDDTWVAWQIEKGNLSSEDALNHPRRHALLRCLGHGDLPLFQTTVGFIGTECGYVLCSDGFYQHLGSCEIAQITNTGAIEEAVRYAVQRIYHRGATDNLSAIALQVQKYEHPGG